MISPDIQHWIFDLDGTLTKPVHDFTEIRGMLGLDLDSELGILEQLYELPRAARAPLFARLDAFELELAQTAEPSDGAHALLESLRSRGIRLGIVTRNNDINVDATLKAAGLDGFFDRDQVVTRETGPTPKPDPDGILHLVGRWSIEAERAVMIGNHLIDVEAGRGAGTITVLLDQNGVFEWGRPADFHIESLAELL